MLLEESLWRKIIQDDFVGNIDDMYTKKRPALSEPSVSYFFLPDPNVGCQPAAVPFWLGAAAIVLIFSFFGFLDSRLPLCSPFAKPFSLGLVGCHDGSDVMVRLRHQVELSRQLNHSKEHLRLVIIIACIRIGCHRKCNDAYVVQGKSLCRSTSAFR